MGFLCCIIAKSERKDIAEVELCRGQIASWVWGLTSCLIAKGVLIIVDFLKILFSLHLDGVLSRFVCEHI
ncbi:hypothetical protein RHMOL_Rhmol08G0050100 [Rhododendron molle]|uniref:Uncharacterized protein n=1 Tax=Rhododendron molle TaxID=49168 RepID=A0ACC0MLE3_RHOML|nr:hypothetical protein RHMOL_Rhmol08G0050100 [Rhododendron molle]